MNPVQPLSTVLVVEDDPDASACIGRYLSDAGYQVVCAMTGSGAVASAVRHRPDAIVLDVQLPDVDGVDLAERFRDFSFLSTAPILFLTGRGDSHVIQAAHWMRNTKYLRKPCDQATLLSELSSALQCRKSTGGDSCRTSQIEQAAFELPHCEVQFSPLPVAGLRNALDHLRSDDASAISKQHGTITLCDLIDDVSHDAQSTLFVLSEFASQASKDLEGPEHCERRQTLRVIEDRIVELRVLFDLLSASRRVQTQQLPGRCEPVSLQTFLEPLAADFSRLCRRKSCTLSVSVDDFADLIDTDVHHTRIAVTSLFSHVLFVCESSSTIQLHVSRTSHSGTPVAQIAIHALTVAERSEFVTRADFGNGPDPCDIAHQPKCALAAAVLESCGGMVALNWSQRTFSAFAYLPLTRGDSDSSSVEITNYVSAYSGD